MSWDGYIDSTLGGCKGAADTACIIGLEGGAAWTTNQHASALNLQPTEAQEIANAMKLDNHTSFQEKGVMIGGEKYQFLRGDIDEGLVLAKKKDKGSVTIQKSNTAIVLAHTIEGKGQGDTNGGVLNVVNYLKGLNM